VTFADQARRLAGVTSAALGWPPAVFWDVTPAELAAVFNALAGDVPELPDLSALMELFPDG